LVKHIISSVRGYHEDRDPLQLLHPS